MCEIFSETYAIGRNPLLLLDRRARCRDGTRENQEKCFSVETGMESRLSVSARASGIAAGGPLRKKMLLASYDE
jgi:hypothetical protein